MTRLNSRTIKDNVTAALSRGAVVRRTFTIAGASVTVDAEESIAAALIAPLEHLASIEASEPDLSIQVAELRGDLNELASLPDSGSVLAEGDTVVHLHRDSAAVLDRAAGTIHALLSKDRHIASWRRAKPLQLPLSIFFADRGIDLLHGGLVSHDGNGLLIVGNSGSGKSTLSISAMLEGLEFLGDDCVAVQGLRGFSVFGSGCLAHDHLQRFSVTSDDRDGEKAVLPIAATFRDRMATTAVIRAIVVPRVTGADRVSVFRSTAREALLALAPGSILKRAVPARGALSQMARLVSQVPVFSLEMGPVREAGARMARLLEEVAA